MKDKAAAFNIFRHEIKYYISKRETVQLQEYLTKHMQLDSFAGMNGMYWVRSLYFDSPDNTDYNDKIIGYSDRKKIRLRIYSVEDTQIKLELKMKQGSYISKKTVVIEKDDALKLIEGDSSCLLKYRDNTANEIYAFMHFELYRPRVLVDYERQAYLCPFENIRVTIDKNVRASLNTSNLFVYDTPMISVLGGEGYILEIKFNTMLPDFIRSFISNTHPELSSISKYCLARQAIHI